MKVDPRGWKAPNRIFVLFLLATTTWLPITAWLLVSDTIREFSLWEINIVTVVLIIFILIHIPLLALFNSYSARIISVLLGVMPILWFGIAVVAGLAWKYQNNHPIFALILILGFIYFCFALARLHYRHFDMDMMMYEYYRQTADGEHPASGEWLLLNQHWGIRYISNATVPSHKPMHSALNSCSTVSIGGLVFIGMLLQALITGLVKQIGGHEIIITINGRAPAVV
ncbi:hypothetical protein [uncultured Thiothrix sp.]|uniref:hypothetical protein n=1 Tax=uncultured Thiothrix sp. TaxID=223185 RepID=UPI0026391F59|nr:hypothetical protein [uncultured Thiothrix sp.]